MSELPKDERGKPATDRLNYTAYRLARALNRAAENTALAHGLTLPQLLILQVLGEGTPLSNAQVARRTFVSSQAAHVVSSELLANGLIERAEHPTNRRVRLVRLSETGWAVLHDCERDIIAREDRLTDELGSTLGSTLPEILDRAADALAGGYFGDRQAEAEAVALRKRPSRGSGMAPV